MRAGWLFYGLPKDASAELRNIIDRYFQYTLQRYNHGFDEITDCTRYLSHADENIARVKAIIENTNPDTLKGYETLKSVKVMLDMNQKTLSNIQRIMVHVNQVMCEPMQPTRVESIAVKEEYISCRGERCLVLEGKVPGRFWDLEEAKQYQ